MRAKWPCLLLGMCTAACAPKTGAVHGASSDHCAVRSSAAAPGTPPPDAEVPASQLIVEARAKKSALSREIGKRVPQTLASVRQQPQGAVGNVSYVVTRGPIGVSLKGADFVATVPVGAEVEICKPLGPVCIRYGACSPRLSAQARVPLLLGDDYSLKRARVAIALTRSCVIAGFDAGPEIRKNAGRQIGGIERQINSAVPPFRPFISGAWQLLHVPISLSRNSCLKIEPRSLKQSPPKDTNDVISMRLGAELRASLEEPCAESKAAKPAPALPPRQIDPSLPAESELRVPLRLGWADVSAALSRSSAGGSGPSRVLRIRASGQLQGQAPRVRLDVTADGVICGEVSFLTQPYFDAERGRIRLRKIEPLAAMPGAGALAEHIEAHAEVPVAVDIDGAARGLKSAVEAAVADVPKDVRVDLDIEPAQIDRVVAESRGIFSVLLLRGVARVVLD